jgi:Cellulose binding domain
MFRPRMSRHGISRHRATLTLVGAMVLAAAAVLLGVAPAAYAAGVSAAFSKDSDWGTGYQARYTITNGTASTITSWTVAFDLPSGTSMGTYWDALVSTSGQHVTATNRNYNGTVAPGATVVFGFIVSGSGVPANCTINGGACAGGTTTSAPPTTTRPPTSTPPTSAPPTTRPPTTAPPSTGPPPPAGAVPVAPYIDMGSWPTPLLSQVSSASGLRSFTLAFITASGCKAMWFNAYDPRTGWQLDEINRIRAAGGDVKISFGGASGIELAQACTDVNALTAEYQAVVSAYALRYIDFDIEGSATAEPASIARRNQAMARLQASNPNLRISLTLPVLPEGLTADGLNVVRTARDAGVIIDLVNIMAMDYYRTGDYGDFAVTAANNTFAQLKSLYPARTDAQVWRMLGVTPMLGVNDDQHIFDQNDARQLVTTATGRHLGMLAFWEVTRDRNACTGALYMCTNIAQQPYEFSRIFTGFTG